MSQLPRRHAELLEIRGERSSKLRRTATVEVIEGGLRVESLERATVDALVVTPAHQYPTGVVLRPERRAALVAWAQRRGTLIVEDDYDAEFRYDREPIGTLQGLSPDHVVYAGSASKMLVPGLRLGWLVVPASLAGPIARAKRAEDLGSAVIDQLAFADFVASGELDRHLRRMRPIYRRRRDTLLAALRRHLPKLRPVGASAGLHVLAWLPPSVHEARALRAAADAGIGLDGLAESRVRSGGSGALIFGYAAVEESTIAVGGAPARQSARGRLAPQAPRHLARCATPRTSREARHWELRAMRDPAPSYP